MALIQKRPKPSHLTSAPSTIRVHAEVCVRAPYELLNCLKAAGRVGGNVHGQQSIGELLNEVTDEYQNLVKDTRTLESGL